MTKGGLYPPGRPALRFHGHAVPRCARHAAVSVLYCPAVDPANRVMHIAAGGDRVVRVVRGAAQGCRRRGECSPQRRRAAEAGRGLSGTPDRCRHTASAAGSMQSTG